MQKFVSKFGPKKFGRAFDESYDKIRNRVANMLRSWTGNSEKFVSGFLTEYGEKHPMLGKIMGIKKQKSDPEEEEEDAQLSDFDF